MGIKERRDGEKSEMRRRIMEAATEIINQEGYEKLSIRKIASKIEYSPTTIYLYYKDKAEIIGDMSNALYGKVMDAIIAESENSIKALDARVSGMLRILITELCNEPEMAKAIMSSESNVIFADGSGAGTPSNPGMELLDNLISDGIADNTFRPNMENTSWMLVSALLGFVMTSIANQLYLQDNFDRFTENFISILMNGMRL